MTEDNETAVETTATEITRFGDNQNADLVFYSDEEMETALKTVERRNEFIERTVQMALKKLMPTDFHDFGGKPFLQGVGAERLKKFFGISVVNVRRIPERGYEIIEGDSARRLRVTYRATYSIGKMTVDAEGSRDTHNDFLCKANSAYKDISDIDLPDLDAAARTALDRDGVTRLLGLRGITWDYLKNLGFTKDKTTGHDYNTGKKGGDKAAGNKDAIAQRKEIGEMLMEMSDGSPDAAASMLADFSAWKDKDGKSHAGKKNLADLTVNQIPIIHSKVKKQYDEFVEARRKAQEDDMQDDPLNDSSDDIFGRKH